MAELTGREAGISHGKGGSMHMFSASTTGFYGGHGIVGRRTGSLEPLGVQAQIFGGWRHLLSYLGDGAVNQGQVLREH